MSPSCAGDITIREKVWTGEMKFQAMSPSCAGDIAVRAEQFFLGKIQFQAMSPSCAGDISWPPTSYSSWPSVSSHVAELRWRHLACRPSSGRTATGFKPCRRAALATSCSSTRGPGSVAKFQAMSPSCAGDIPPGGRTGVGARSVSSHVAELRWRHPLHGGDRGGGQGVSSHVAELRWRHPQESQRSLDSRSFQAIDRKSVV